METFSTGSKHLKTPEQRTESVVRSVVASSRAEGIEVNASEVRKVAAERVQSKLKTEKSEA
jgi:hypothetical protein